MLPTGHPIAKAPRVSLAEVVEEPLILLDVPPTVERVQAIFRARGLSPQLRWTSSNMETIRSMVARGLGYSFVNMVPRTNITYDALEVSYVLLADDIPANPIMAALPRGHRAARRVNAAIEFLHCLRAEERSACNW
jgi:DNA-binding transcriptional LysR family regulator